jgi:hypothetical protein
MNKISATYELIPGIEVLEFHCCGTAYIISDTFPCAIFYTVAQINCCDWTRECGTKRLRLQTIAIDYGIQILQRCCWDAELSGRLITSHFCRADS